MRLTAVSISLYMQATKAQITVCASAMLAHCIYIDSIISIVLHGLTHWFFTTSKSIYHKSSNKHPGIYYRIVSFHIKWGGVFIRG